jgi:hypothetical protein
MSRFLAVAVLILVAWFALAPPRGGADGSARDFLPGGAAAGGDAAIEHAYARQLGNVQIEGQGVVVKLLADDHDGSRHQRFILRLASGRTVLVAHNIDLAARVETLRVGDTVTFYGEYEWSRKGGVIHWTHHDPQARHPDGWLRHGGRVYR